MVRVGVLGRGGGWAARCAGPWPRTPSSSWWRPSTPAWPGIDLRQVTASDAAGIQVGAATSTTSSGPAPRWRSTSPWPTPPSSTCAGARRTACTPWSARAGSPRRRGRGARRAVRGVRGQLRGRPQLRHRRRPHDALGRAGRPLHGRGRDHRAAPRRQGRRPVGHRHAHRRAPGPGPPRRRGDPWAPDRTAPTWWPGRRGGAGPGAVRVHSVRLPGLVAHQEVIFGARARASPSATTPTTARRSCPG